LSPARSTSGTPPNAGVPRLCAHSPSMLEGVPRHCKSPPVAASSLGQAPHRSSSSRAQARAREEGVRRGVPHPLAIVRAVGPGPRARARTRGQLIEGTPRCDHGRGAWSGGDRLSQLTAGREATSRVASCRFGSPLELQPFACSSLAQWRSPQINSTSPGIPVWIFEGSQLRQEARNGNVRVRARRCRARNDGGLANLGDGEGRTNGRPAHAAISATLPRRWRQGGATG
jgi:hypothetical protein